MNYSFIPFDRLIWKFMFLLHRHLPAKQALNSKQSAKGCETIIQEILRISGYFCALFYTEGVSYFKKCSFVENVQYCQNVEHNDSALLITINLVNWWKILADDGSIPPCWLFRCKTNYQKRVKLIFTFVAAADVKKVSFYKKDNIHAVMH